METVVIKRRIGLPPVSLGPGIKASLLRRAKENYKNECTKDHGYLVDVNRVVRIVDNTVTSAESDAVFTVELEMTMMKPDKGKKFTGEVGLVVPQGLFVVIKDTMRVLVPISNMTSRGYTMEKKASMGKTTMWFSKGDTTLGVGESVDVTVVNTQYSEGKFSVIGELS